MHPSNSRTGSRHSRNVTASTATGLQLVGPALTHSMDQVFTVIGQLDHLLGDPDGAGHAGATSGWLHQLRCARRQLDDVLLVGSTKTDSISQSYLIEVGQNLRLVCGKSILELNASGQINLSGVAINFHASGDAEFNTGGVLNLNIGGGPGATPDGQGDKGSIDAAVKSLFGQEKGNS